MENSSDQEEEQIRFDFKDLLEQQKLMRYGLYHLFTERSDHIKSLPDATKRRISALKKLQMEYLDAESKFYEEIHKNACKMQERLVELHYKRNNIINGEFTPNDSDLLENDDSLDSSQSVPNPTDFQDNGIEDFWLIVLKCGKLTCDLIHPQDEPILKKLTNIRVVMHEAEPMGFTLEFVFAPNEYFSNNVLTKTYYLKFAVDEDDPFEYEGPEINNCKGCTINWFKGKNLTVKTIKKKQKHKAAPMTRIVTKTLKVSSFFHFFSPPKVPVDKDFINETLEDEIDFDFEVGHYMKERLIPRAVLFFTGIGIELESSIDDSEEEETETEEDDEAEPPNNAIVKKSNNLLRFGAANP